MKNAEIRKHNMEKAKHYYLHLKKDADALYEIAEKTGSRFHFEHAESVLSEYLDKVSAMASRLNRAG